jgi:hypothetical protein
MAPFIVEGAPSIGINSMILIGLIGTTGLFFYPLFRETHNKPLLNFIQELNALPEEKSLYFLNTDEEE